MFCNMLENVVYWRLGNLFSSLYIFTQNNLLNNYFLNITHASAVQNEQQVRCTIIGSCSLNMKYCSQPRYVVDKITKL